MANRLVLHSRLTRPLAITPACPLHGKLVRTVFERLGEEHQNVGTVESMSRSTSS